MQYQKTILELMKKALEGAKKDHNKVTTDPFPLIMPDLTEMSDAEFLNALQKMPVNFNSDYLYDLKELRRLLGSFNHPSRLKVLRVGASYTQNAGESLYYKGL